MKRYAKCAAPGCFQGPRPFSRYCPHHFRKLERTRDLRGRVLTKGELRGDRALSLEFIERRSKHPAVAAAVAYMADLIAPSDKAGFLRSEFDRLRGRGATPETMLASAMAFFMWAERHGQWEQYGLKPFSPRCFDLNLGRAVLSTVPARTYISSTGKLRYVRVRPGHAEGLGQNLRLAVGVLCLSCVRKILKDSGWYAPDERGRAILEALKAAPLEQEEDDEQNDDN